MLKTQLSPLAANKTGNAGIQQIASLHMAIPIKNVIMNAKLPLAMVVYVCGRVAVLRIPDGSNVMMFKLSDPEGARICWSADQKGLCVVDDGELLEYSLERKEPARRPVSGRVESHHCTEHLIVLKMADHSLKYLPVNPEFTIDNNNSMGIIDDCSDVVCGKDCIYVLSRECNSAQKYNVSINGQLDEHLKMKSLYEKAKNDKKRLQKATEQLSDSLQKWRNKAFIDFISVQQLTLFFLKYDAKSVKRDGSELQRLDVLFKDALESISDFFNNDIDDVEDRLQQFSRAMSRMTMLLCGADDLELMSVRLVDVIEDVKILSGDFDFVIRLIMSKCELQLSAAREELECHSIQILLTPSFQCHFEGQAWDDYCCIDDDLIMMTRSVQERIVYKNNEEMLRLQLPSACEKTHIASPFCFLSFSDSETRVFSADNSSVIHHSKPLSSVSGRHGIIACLTSESELSIWDLSFM